MIAIFKKEFQSFYSNITGYIITGSFLTLNGLMLWFFKTNGNVFRNGFADLISFFHNVSWIFAILIPAITMKSFADEYKNGTIEILKTLPISNTTIITGKFLAYLLVIIICLLPTSIYVISIYYLGNPVGNIDLGSTFISYIGTVLIAITYISVGFFSSIISKNNISAIIIALAINLFLYFGLEVIDHLPQSKYALISNWSIQYHFESILRGVIDISDLMYFISLTTVFLLLTLNALKND